MPVLSEKPIRVGFYDSTVTCDGAGRVLLALLQRLDRHRIQPVCFFPAPGPLADAVAALGVPLAIVPPVGVLKLRGKRALSGSVMGKLRLARDVYRYGRRLAVAFRTHGIDVLHCNQTRSLLQAGWGARRAGIPTLWSVRIKEPLPRWIVRLADRWSDYVVAMSPDLLDDFAGADSLRAKCEVLVEPLDATRFPSGLDGRPVRAEFGMAPDEPLIVMVALLAPRKRHDIAIRAMPIIVQHFPAAKLLLVGGPSRFHATYPDELRQLIAQLDLDDHVLLTGRREDIPSVLAAADVFVLPSVQEGFSVAVMEAMMAGTAVVVTPQAGRALQHGHTGLVIPEDDPGALAAAVIKLLRNPALRLALGNAARRHALAHWTEDTTIRRYEELYRQLACTGCVNSQPATSTPLQAAAKSSQSL